MKAIYSAVLFALIGASFSLKMKKGKECPTSLQDNVDYTKLTGSWEQRYYSPSHWFANMDCYDLTYSEFDVDKQSMVMEALYINMTDDDENVKEGDIFTLKFRVSWGQQSDSTNIYPDVSSDSDESSGSGESSGNDESLGSGESSGNDESSGSSGNDKSSETSESGNTSLQITEDSYPEISLGLVKTDYQNYLLLAHCDKDEDNEGDLYFQIFAKEGRELTPEHRKNLKQDISDLVGYKIRLNRSPHIKRIQFEQCRAAKKKLMEKE